LLNSANGKAREPRSRERFPADRRRMTRMILAGLVAGTALLSAAGYVFLRHLEDISTSAAAVSPEAPAALGAGKPTVSVGVVSRYNPTMIYQGYQPIMDYLTSVTPYRFELRLGNSYAQTVADLVAGRVAAAFLGNLVYLNAHRRYAVLPVLKPLNEHGQPFYSDVVITRDDSPVATLSDLRGRSLALPSAESFSAAWLTHFALARVSLRPEDLKQMRSFDHHYTVVFQVLRGAFDAGVVREHVATEYLSKGIRIIARSDPLPTSPIVVRHDHDPAITSVLRDALLALDPSSPAGRATVVKWDPEFTHGFARARDEDYQPLRALLASAGLLP
jgi:phosphonate transport system substrate-binding protein